MSIKQQTRQRARLDSFAARSRIAGELVANCIPGLGIDQSRMLAGVELTLVRDLADVHRVGEQPVEVPAREGSAAALGAVPCRATLCSQAEAIGLILEAAHAAKLAIEREDLAYRLGLGRVDDKGAPARLIAERHDTAHPQALLLRGGDLVADEFASNLALKEEHPIGFG